MIDAFISNGKYLQVNKLNPYIPYMQGTGSGGNGMLRYNSSNHSIEAYDGQSSWHAIGSAVNLELTPSATQALDWAMKKMEEETTIQNLATQYPAVRDLKDQIDNIKEKLDVVLALVRT